jgi:DNA-binding HxlR family transcriptional regulator
MQSTFVSDHRFVPADVGQMEAAIGVIQGRWKLLILSHLFARPTVRFNELKRLMPDISGRVLTYQLRALEAEGVVQRQVYPQIPPRVDYSLTETGRQLELVLNGLLSWSAAQNGSAASPRAH